MSYYGSSRPQFHNPRARAAGPREMDSKFPGTCTACGCRFPAGTHIIYLAGTGAKHATVGACAEAKKERWAKEQAAAAAGPKLNLTTVVDFLKAAQARGLKAPKMRVLGPDGKTELRLSVTTRGQAPGSVGVTLGYDFIGCVRPDGSLTNRLRDDERMQEHLRQIAAEPAVAAKQYAVLMGLCSFCGKELTDEGSVEVGYGPVCAAKYGLPHRPKGTPVFAGQPPAAPAQTSLALGKGE